MTQISPFHVGLPTCRCFCSCTVVPESMQTGRTWAVISKRLANFKLNYLAVSWTKFALDQDLGQRWFLHVILLNPRSNRDNACPPLPRISICWASCCTLRRRWNNVCFRLPVTHTVACKYLNELWCFFFLFYFILY